MLARFLESELAAAGKTARPFQRELTSRSDVKAQKRRAADKKKARRMTDAPSNKTYGNCLLGLHCSQKRPAATRANA
jgi:hypothetical protein